MRLFVVLCLFISCGEKGEPLPPIQEDSGTESDTNEPDDTDTEEPGTDEDGDGFTVEDGDCDDSDPWTNPARDEESNDGIDNDCDGRVDEKWSGITVSLINAAGPSSLVTINQIGNIDSEVSLTNDCVPTYLDHGASDGWVISNANSGLATVSSTGDCNLLVDFSEDEENTDLYGVVSHPDGYYYASRGNQLIKVEDDGTVTEVVSWDASIIWVDENGEPILDADGFMQPNPNYQLFVWSIARNIVTGEIGLFGLYGGFATWSEETGLVVHKQIDVAEEYGSVYAYAGAVKDGGGWFTMLFDGETGEISVARFNHQENEWVTRIAWSEQDQSAQEFAFPQGLTVNGDTGDYYITADVASFSTVFRIREADEFIDDLYRSNSEPNWTFYGIVSNY
jgi:hypothetical protein